MPTAMVVPNASPRAKRLAAKADMLNGIMGWWTRRGALMSIFTELQPKEIWSRRTKDIHKYSSSLLYRHTVYGYICIRVQLELD